MKLWGYREEIEDAPENTKTDIVVGLSEPEYSTQVLLCTPDRTAVEHSPRLSTTEFLRKLAFPQRDRVLRFSTHHITERGFKGEG